MPLRIGCDLDGTLVDLKGALHREAEQLFGPGFVLRADPRLDIPPDEGAEIEAAPVETPPSASSGGTPLSATQMRELWKHVKKIENFWTTLHEIEPGSVSCLAKRAAKHRWEVIFLTRRPATAGETAQVQSQRWLQAHGFELPSVYVGSQSRGAVAAALHLDVIIDDRSQGCIDVVADSGARSILVWRGREQDVPAGIKNLGVHPVFSFRDALQHLEAMTQASTSSRVMDRIRSVFGRRPQ